MIKLLFQTSVKKKTEGGTGKKLKVKDATEAYIDALCYRETHESLACWRTCDIVNCELSKLKSKASKINALKETLGCMLLV